MSTVADLVCPITGNRDAAPFVEQNGFTWVRFKESGYAQCLFDESQDDSNVNADTGMATGYLDEFDRKRESKLRRTARRAKFLKRRLKGPRLVDVGSNVGYFVESARRIGLEAEGIEINPGLCDAASRQFPECRFTNAALEDFDLTGRSFDGVYCSEVIEHVPDVVDFAKRLLGLLGPGGLLYLTTPALDEYMRGDAVVRDLGAPDHRLYFNRRNIVRFLENIGFRSVRHKLAFGGGIQVLAEK